MSSFQRFDLHEASYPLGLLAEKTPAWREVYANILDKLTERYITFWGAVSKSIDSIIGASSCTTSILVLAPRAF